MKKIFFRLSLLTFLFFSASSPVLPKAIVWDLGGVLFRVKKFKMACFELGLHNILWYTVRDFQNPKNLQKRLFETLYHFGKQNPEDNNGLVARGGSNNLELPLIMCEWQKGQLSPTAIIKAVHTAMDELEKENFFVSSREKKLLKKIIVTVFDPKVLAQYTNPVNQADCLLKDINQQNCEQFIISNWDPNSFNLLYKSDHGQKVFSHFDPEHIIISGKCGLMKPDTKIFEHAAEKFNINPAECIFIDDQYENIQAAQKCGFQTIWFNNMTLNDVRAELYKRGFLTSTSNSKVEVS